MNRRCHRCDQPTDRPISHAVTCWWAYRQGRDIGHPLRDIKAIELRDALAADISDTRSTP